MKRIAAIAMLYVIASMPVHAADDGNVYASLKLDMEAENAPVDETRQFIVERIESLSKFSLLEVNDDFSLYGKLSFRHRDNGDANNVTPRNAPTYGLRGQFNSTHGIGIRFGWDRYIVKQSSGDNTYSLTAVFKF